MHNIAGKPEFAEALKGHWARVDEWMKQTKDPRLDPNYDGWDKAKYYGKPTK
jgi:hypothetical protein